MHRKSWAQATQNIGLPKQNTKRNARSISFYQIGDSTSSPSSIMQLMSRRESFPRLSLIPIFDPRPLAHFCSQISQSLGKSHLGISHYTWPPRAKLSSCYMFTHVFIEFHQRIPMVNHNPCYATGNQRTAGHCSIGCDALSDKRRPTG